MIVVQCRFPQFADGLGNSVQAYGLLLVLINLVDLNLQLVQRLCSIFDKYIFSKNTFYCLVIKISISA